METKIKDAVYLESFMKISYIVVATFDVQKKYFYVQFY